MYTPGGQAVYQYAEAVEKAGFHLFWGPSAKKQSPDLGDVLLHETAVSWVRRRLRRSKPQVLPWLETREQWVARLRKVVREVNKDCDAKGLCCEFPARLEDLKARDGDRLPK